LFDLVTKGSTEFREFAFSNWHARCHAVSAIGDLNTWHFVRLDAILNF
jgi:hypothetical protein